MAKGSDAITWLEMLFQEGDIFEVRVKAEQDTGAKVFWYPFEKRKEVCEVHLDIHEAQSRHIWIGVLPRDAYGSSAPGDGNVLWCDFNATIKTAEHAEAAITQAGIPAPSMLVCSGNGVHGYWNLTERQPLSDLQVRSRGLHACLPADNTHDVSRIMRVPGTRNPKGAGTDSYIVSYDPELQYPITDFPTLETSLSTPDAYTPRPRRPLLAEDRESIQDSWVEGQRHHLALGVAGYLRKALNWSKDEAWTELQALHEESGGQVDGGLRKILDDTYSKPLTQIGASTILWDHGIVTTGKGLPDFVLPVLPVQKKSHIDIIDFTVEQQQQEWWVRGLIGPGLLTLWAAEPKVGKSYASMQIGHALSTGEPLWDLTVLASKKVLYFQGELSQGMVAERAESLFGRTSLIDVRQFALTAKPNEAINLVKQPEVLMDLAENYDVVIIDPISVFHGNDEVGSVSVNEVIGVFDRLIAQNKAVILIHHTRKLDVDSKGRPRVPSFNDIRGSGQWFARADAIALMYRWGEEGNVRVKFQFRAAPDRDELELYRLPTGGFTHNRERYLNALPRLKVNLDPDRTVN